MLALILVASVLAATPTAVDSDGIVQGKMVTDQTCDNAHNRSCLQIINDGNAALQIGTSFVGPSGSDGVEVALVKVRGKRQCVFTTSSSGTRCVSVLGPGQIGWIKFPSTQVVTITVTQWEMGGLDTGHDSFIPGTAIPAYVIGDERLIGQGSLATKGETQIIPKDLKVPGNNILHLKY